MELNWRRSSYSDNLGGNCVEVAPVAGGVGVRDSKVPGGSVILLGPVVFRALLAELKRWP
ncbi:DUF397 domain-containing protein [Actinomadura sp. NAK00032]|nr:DUF397 domain-containing protein [Actinomadura sp. NAK00032]QKW34219.1 DUF397 domain-containing protein [Actinomadura sp. NAK00032]